MSTRLSPKFDKYDKSNDCAKETKTLPLSEFAKIIIQKIPFHDYIYKAISNKPILNYWKGYNPSSHHEFNIEKQPPINPLKVVY